jgi:hypothetical protein
MDGASNCYSVTIRSERRMDGASNCYSVTNIVTLINTRKSRCTRLAKQVARLKEIRNAYNFFFFQIFKKLRRRPSRR